MYHASITSTVLTFVSEAEPESESETVAEETTAAETVESPSGEIEGTTVTEKAPAGQVPDQSANAESAASGVEEKTFTLNLAASDIDKEMEKRKARAERFKTSGQANANAEVTETTTADTDALKNLERAKRFGTSQTAIGMLDSALPSERERGPRGKKRDAAPVEENATLDDPGLKPSFNRRGRHGKDKRRKVPLGSKPTGVTKAGGAAYTNEKDRQAAEARKKRFATSS